MITVSNEKAAWESFFGKAWTKITEFCPEIGGFLICHETRSVYLDDNARALAGLERNADYDGMLELLGMAGKNAGAQAAVQIVSFDEKYTAGILKHRDHAEHSPLAARAAGDTDVRRARPVEVQRI